jgi:general secretion pathway protein F
MQLEARLSRDIQNALVYPAFLVLGGALSIAFILYAVAPRFAEMLGQARTQLDPLSAGIISAGVWFHGNAVLAALVFAGAVAALFAFAATGEGKRLLAGVAYAVPGLGGLLKARQRTTWSRIMAILLAAGVDVLAATRTAAEALSEGALRRNALAAIAHLRAGRSVDQAFLAANAVSPIEASVIAAGSRSGALAAMFEAVAQKAEEDTRDALKRFTTILEPLAIALVAGFIGMIVVALVSALAGIYEAIG